MFHRPPTQISLSLELDGNDVENYKNYMRSQVMNEQTNQKLQRRVHFNEDLMLHDTIQKPYLDFTAQSRLTSVNPEQLADKTSEKASEHSFFFKKRKIEDSSSNSNYLGGKLNFESTINRKRLVFSSAVNNSEEYLIKQQQDLLKDSTTPFNINVMNDFGSNSCNWKLGSSPRDNPIDQAKTSTNLFMLSSLNMEKGSQPSIVLSTPTTKKSQ